MTPPASLGVYVHWPYCARVCPYCDFNVVRDRGRAEEKAALAGAIVADLRAHRDLTGPRELASIFFGGGTPSLMDPAAAAAIIDAARALWTPAADLEVTLEANPTNAEAGRFSDFAQAGVGRLSLGLQSLNDIALRFLGRDHDAAAGRRAADIAAKVFSRVSLDLIYALPGQTPAAWAEELREAIALGPEHLSPYQLTIEPGTAFDRAVRRGVFAPSDSDHAADLYEATQAVLGAAGFEAYEVSNHAKGLAARSRHNLTYWRGGDYLGVGPGAHGRVTLEAGRFATAAPRGIGAYLERVGTMSLGSRRERLGPRDIALERLLMGSRTLDGVALSDLRPLRIDSSRVASLAPLATTCDDRLMIAAEGRPLLDRILAELAHGA
ncbi:MAG: radical SAM family heme chaperone HemW [Caulobacteraceae bacterium]|nr:radical SAM family heme chaperone HemW [Caulobacteraceae bacterium]